MASRQESNLTDLETVERQLQSLIEREEAAHTGKTLDQTDSLWWHSLRVAALAEKIGAAEGVDRTACRLAGLFHDAGKFARGEYHPGEMKEEDRSIQILLALARERSLEQNLVDAAVEAIRQMSWNAAEPPLLAKIVCDADNLDKLGLPGVGNFFIKAGLRGRGLNRDLLYRISVELTYARYARHSMMTRTGRNLATAKVSETINFFEQLLDALREDELLDFRISRVEHDGLLLDLVESRTCACGSAIERSLWNENGLKCLEIHVEHRCTRCSFTHRMHFCRPRLS